MLYEVITSALFHSGIMSALRSINIIPFNTIIEFMTSENIDMGRALANIGGNIAIFVPLGVFVAYAARNKPLRISFLCLLLTSFAFEVIQYVFALGSSDIVITSYSIHYTKLYEEWFETMQLALHMDKLITRHSAIMDQYDPKKRVGLIIDEWGNWFQVEPGTNPGFLYQQNSMRDALVAGLHFHIFHRHCDRVHMANIAQTVNVLQAMILTEGERNNFV